MNKTIATATVEDGYNGATKGVHVTMEPIPEDIFNSHEHRIYAHFKGDSGAYPCTYCLGSIDLMRHNRENALAHFLREHSAVIGFEIGAHRVDFMPQTPKD